MSETLLPANSAGMQGQSQYASAGQANMAQPVSSPLRMLIQRAEGLNGTMDGIVTSLLEIEAEMYGRFDAQPAMNEDVESANPFDGGTMQEFFVHQDTHRAYLTTISRILARLQSKL